MDFFFKKKGLRVRVAALIENSQNEILLIQQKKKDSYYWLLPGGGIEFGESAEDALKRELKEELSLEMKSASFLLLNESNRTRRKETSHSTRFFCERQKGSSGTQFE